MFDPLQHALAIVRRESGELVAFAESTYWLAEEGFREVGPDIPESETITAIYDCYVITRNGLQATILGSHFSMMPPEDLEGRHPIPFIWLKDKD